MIKYAILVLGLTVWIAGIVTVAITHNLLPGFPMSIIGAGLSGTGVMVLGKMSKW